ncbi:hypothetical protein FSP39_010591 [Pinctada imbricata]|uniref:Acid phosphatase n=1 Tax=Pinctada imbricata TaxID=66713 RepID=A0AA89BKI8_PINIB|nr:hypothetical protein FSP39_010591 [Pinctada imbricata]
MWATSDDVRGHVMYGDSMNSLHFHAKSTVAILQSDSWNALRNIHRAQMEERTRHFLVYGDLGSYFGKPTYPVLKEEVDTEQYDAVWHIGDFAYDLNVNGGKYGDVFFDLIEPVASRIPYMTLPGNHEYADDFHHYRVRFSMPGTTWPMELDRLWFSYNIGLVHFISFSTEVYFVHNQNQVCTQYDWLLQDLTEANRNRDKQPWIVAMGHRPMYCSNDEPKSDCTPGFFHYWVRNGLEDLFHYMGVDLLIMGHEHSYERFWPMYRQKVFAQNYMDPEGTVHVISGAAGCNEIYDKMGTPVPGSAFRVDSRSYHSYGKLTVYNSTHLQFIQKTVKPRGELDNFMIVQHRHGPRIKDLDCEKGVFAVCRCPFPFHFVTAAVASGIGLLLAIVLITICCCRNCKCCPLFKGKRCCRNNVMKGRRKKRNDDLHHNLEPDTYNLLDHIDPDV